MGSQLALSSRARRPRLGLWKDRNFDDIGWLAGEGAFGYDTGNRYQPVTVFSDMNGVYSIGVLPRQLHAVDDPAARCMLGVLVDDGYIAYLNGVEVARDNLDDPLTHNSLAEQRRQPVVELGHRSRAPDATTTPNPTMTQVDISAFTNLLVVGKNTLAVRAPQLQEDERRLPVLGGAVRSQRGSTR